MLLTDVETTLQISRKVQQIKKQRIKKESEHTGKIRTKKNRLWERYLRKMKWVISGLICNKIFKGAGVASLNSEERCRHEIKQTTKFN